MNQCSFSRNFPQFFSIKLAQQNLVDVLIPIGLNVISAVAKEQIPSESVHVVGCCQQIWKHFGRLYSFFPAHTHFLKQIHLIIMSYLQAHKDKYIQSGIIHLINIHAHNMPTECCTAKHTLFHTREIKSIHTLFLCFFSFAFFVSFPYFIRHTLPIAYCPFSKDYSQKFAKYYNLKAAIESWQQISQKYMLYK